MWIFMKTESVSWTDTTTYNKFTEKTVRMENNAGKQRKKKGRQDGTRVGK